MKICPCPECGAKPSVGKKIAKAAVATATTAAAVGGVLYLAKTGKLNPTEGGNKVLEFVKKGLKSVADPVLEKLGVLKAKVVASEIAGKAVDKAVAIKDGAIGIFGKVKEGAKKVAGFVGAIFTNGVDKVKNFAESFSNKAKFDVSKANPADIAAETFNNFVK